MLKVKRSIRKSWLDPEGAKILGPKMAKALQERLPKGGRFITLTYAREGWDSPKHIYDDASERRHVRRFMQKLSDALGVDLKGMWIRKLEFQADGTPHWHILLDYQRKIPWQTVQACWKYGYAVIKRATKRHMHYMAKYVSKELDNMPGFVMAERVRSVKIFSSSPGFWQREPDPRKKQNKKVVNRSVYRSVGDSIEDQQEQTLCQWKISAKEYHRTVKAPIDVVLAIAKRMGCRMSYTKDGWIEIHDLSYTDLKLELQKIPPQGRENRGRGGLYLNNTPNPPHADEVRLKQWHVDYLLSTGAFMEAA